MAVILGNEVFESELPSAPELVPVLIDSVLLSSASERSDGHFIPIPVSELAVKAGGTPMQRSVAALGVVAALLGLPQPMVLGVLHEWFGGKGRSASESNHLICKAGFDWAAASLTHVQLLVDASPVRQIDDRIIIDGNQAAALGALAAGCSFFASYPITPATPIGEFLARQLPQAGGTAHQAEDEIAAICSALGASFGGKRAMVATSGPGLSLMQEGIGYASMAELPVVIVNVQRPGPSTGMATRQAQDDLLAAVHGGHGEGQRIVLAPRSVQECFDIMATAFTTAQAFRCPVIVLTDSLLATTKMTADAQQFTGTAASSGELPLQRIVTGIEHDEDGFPVETPSGRTRQMVRRAEKMERVATFIPGAAEVDCDDGPPLADVAVCAWGSTVASVKSAVQELRKKGMRIAALYPRLLYPLCGSELDAWSAASGCRIIIEGNASGQYAALVATRISVPVHALTTCDGEPLQPTAIAFGIQQIVQQEAVNDH